MLEVWLVTELEMFVVAVLEAGLIAAHDLDVGTCKSCQEADFRRTST